MMAAYLANQIILGKLTYDLVITRKPELKDEIDAYLTVQGRTDLITA